MPAVIRDTGQATQMDSGGWFRAPAAKRRRSAPRSPGSSAHWLAGPDRIVLGLMVGIPLGVEIIMVWVPTILSLALSFTQWNGLELRGLRFAGLSNYDYVFNAYPPFWPAVWNNVLWLIALAGVATPLGILLAVVLDRNIRGSRIYQSVFFAPVMMSMALVGIVWQLMYARDAGLINNLLGTAGTGAAIDWMGDSSINIWAALVAAVWKHVGYVMTLYLAGLKGLDPALGEAASLDGVSGWRLFRHITFPAMSATNMIVIVITVIESLRAFDIVYVINGGTNGLELISALIIRNLVGQGQVIGIGSALAALLLVASLVPIVAYLVRTFRREEVS